MKLEALRIRYSNTTTEQRLRQRRAYTCYIAFCSFEAKISPDAPFAGVKKFSVHMVRNNAVHSRAVRNLKGYDAWRLKPV